MKNIYVIINGVNIIYKLERIELSMTDEQRRKLVSLFEEAFKDEDYLDHALMLNDPATYEYEAKQVLEEEGFPVAELPDLTVVDFYISITPNKTEEEFADVFIDDYGLDGASSEEVEPNLKMDNIIEFIFNNPDMTNMIVVIKDSVDDVLNEYPTEDYFVEQALEQFDRIALDEELLNMTYDDYPEHIKSDVDDAVADELGSDANPSEVDINVRTVRDITEAQAENLFASDYTYEIPVRDYFNSMSPVYALLEDDSLEVEIVIEE